jgi:enoyl-CoA hydratase/carnithine racemase
MNRPEKKNAFNRAMYREIAESLIRADYDPAVRVVLLTGTEECFTSGNDLGDFRNQSVCEKRPRNPIIDAVTGTKKPLIAAVTGVAVGVGTTILLHCDLVYTGRSARFQLPFVRLGLCPELGSTLLLPLLMGHQRASELLLLGNMFDAETARQVGIVNAVYEDGDVLEMAHEKARELAALPPASVRLTKELLKRSRKHALTDAIEEEIAHFNERLRSPEATEAFKAFAEGRKPDFSQFR